MTHTLASVSVSQSVQNTLNTVAHSLPKIVVFLVVLVIGWIVASIIKRAVQALLKRLHFDRMAERGAIGQALSSRGYNASILLARLIYYAVLLITLQLAFGVFGPNPVSTMLDGMVSWLPKAVVAVILVVIASAIAKVVKDLLGAAMSGLSYGRFVASTAAIVIIALGVIAALNQIDVASSVTGPVLITVLATAGAILAIGVGGGMIRPMEQRWERILDAAERETSSMAAYQRGRQDALNAPGVVAGTPAAQQADVYAGQGAHAGAQGGYTERQGGPQADYTEAQGGGYTEAQSGHGTAYTGQPGSGYDPEATRYADQSRYTQPMPEAPQHGTEMPGGGTMQHDMPPRGMGDEETPPPPHHHGRMP
jgi:Conserved TM helix